MSTTTPKTDEQWRQELTPEEFHILREKGTEPAFTGKYWKTKDDGTYACAGCGAELFSSDTKFDSGSGWPSFSEPMNSEKVEFHEDLSYGMIRTEVTCKNCGGHLGHVFPGGPTPTAQTFCMNSASLKLQPKDS